MTMYKHTPDGSLMRPLIAQPNVEYRNSEEGYVIEIDAPSKSFHFGIMFINSIDPVDDTKSDLVEDRVVGELYFSSKIFLSKKREFEQKVDFTSRFGRNEPFVTELLYGENGDANPRAVSYIAEITLKVNLKDKILIIGFIDTSGIKFHKFITIPGELPFFRYFAWGPMNQEALKIDTVQLNNENHIFGAIRLGKLIVRKGDMFNPDAILNSNVVLFPTSVSGSVNPTIRAKIEELDLPQPPPNKAGQVIIYELGHGKKVFGGYVYSVDDDGSSPKIINQLCKNIINLTKDLKNKNLFIKGINIPLFGTGAGGLQALDVIKIYLDQFAASEPGIDIIVSVPSPEIFDEITDKYRHAYLPLLHEYFNEAPEQIIELQEKLNIELKVSDFEISFHGELISLNLQNHEIKRDLSSLADYDKLRFLGIGKSETEDYSFIEKLTEIRTLNLRNLKIQDYSFLFHLNKLEQLDLSGQRGNFIEQLLPVLNRIKVLVMSHNNFRNVDFLTDLEKLEVLDLGFNAIIDITPLAKNKNLAELTICNNQITSLAPLSRLSKLVFLNASNNKIDSFEAGSLIKRLRFLRIENNPFLIYTDISIQEGGNHIGPVRSFILRQLEEHKVPVKLPAKVLLMGNHASGKSSLLYYLQTGKLAKKVDSTHIIQIEKYPRAAKEMPEAIFYDFGGQDYYHGIYRAFMSGGAINLILWNSKNNRNELRIDSKGHMTQDFSLGYWLAQKQYLEVEKFHSDPSPTFLIQTHADKYAKQVFVPAQNVMGVENDFFVCLSKNTRPVSQVKSDARKKGLKYLKASINSLIEDSRIEREEPKWYIDFLLHIIRQSSAADHRGTKVEALIPHYGRKVKNKLNFLQEDLDQLYRQGLILYYREQIPEMVWLNPVALVTRVHRTILNPDVFGQSGGLIALDAFASEEEHVLNLLLKQKVLYLDEVSRRYIVPNFLPLAKQKMADFELYTFGLGDPIFTLKFRNFLPFGLINQIICFFGDLPEEKKFWRDRIIFTLEAKAKVLINIDFQKLEIKAYASFISGLALSEQLEIKKYLFYGIVGLYWDLNLLKFKDYIAYIHHQLKLETHAPEDPMFDKLADTENFYVNSACRPNDLYISVNEQDFISYCDLCDIGEMININSISVDEDGNFSEKNKSIPVHQFQPFTISELKRRKNVAISYSKQDLHLVNKFREYLVPLYEDELINHPWYCTELIAGTDWDQEIQKKFDAADIIFFMISENLMATRYVMDNEVKNAIDKYNSGKQIKIVPIVMVPYHFQRKGDYNLGRFSALPYTLKPVTLFENENKAWHIISESIRVMIEKDLDPGRDDELPTELKRYFEDVIVEGKAKRKQKKAGTEKAEDKDSA